MAWTIPLDKILSAIFQNTTLQYRHWNPMLLITAIVACSIEYF